MHEFCVICNLTMDNRFIKDILYMQKIVDLLITI